MLFRFIVLSLLLITSCLYKTNVVAQSQGGRPPFNRFQYHNYKWKALHTPLFRLYFPVGYDSLASLASVQLPDVISGVKTAMGAEVRSVPNIVVYPSLDQMYESNIGMHQNDIQTFPTINTRGTRVVLAFDGSYVHFCTQLKAAWARLCWEEQFRNDAEEQLNSRPPKVPLWYKEGAIHFVASGWSIGDENKLQQIILQEATPDWERLTAQEPALAGQAFCYFLAQQYRPDIVLQSLFHMRQGKSLPRALRLITKQRQDSLTARCLRYFVDRRRQVPSVSSIATDTLANWLTQAYMGKLFGLQYNADSSSLLFVIQHYNDRRVFVAQVKDLYNAKLNKSIKPFAHYLMPPWMSEYDSDRYPLLSWNGKGITVTMPVKGKIRMLSFNDRGGPAGINNILYGIDGVEAQQQWNARQWLLSAYRRGRSDIVAYDAGTFRYTALTKDNADHTELILSKADAGLITYRSGYPADSLYHPDTLAKPYGIYSRNITNDFKSAAAGQETLIAQDSAYIEWHQLPGGEALAVINTTAGYADTQLVTNNARPLANTAMGTTRSPWLRDYLRQLAIRDSIKALLAAVDNGEASFLKNVLNPGDTKKAAQLQKDSLRRSIAYTGNKTRPYILQLYSAYFSAQVNNDYFINRFQPYQAYLGTFKFPEVGAMIQGGFSDLFENHHFNIGYRMPAGTEGSDFFVRYENTAKKTDWHVLFFRKVESLEPDGSRDWRDAQGNPYPAAAKVKTHYYELGFHTPLHYDWAIDYAIAARRDRTVFLATDRYSLDYEALQSWWGIGNIALKAYKMRPTIPLLEKGWEGKLLLDGMASTGKQSTMVLGAQLNLSYSQPVIKDITVVTRAQAGYSLGQSKILYNFGGLDNNIVTRVDTSAHFNQNAPFAFQTLVTPFRGYEQNSIYGSRYALLNIDIYFPLFRTLIPLHTGFTSLNNLQVGLFTDLAKTDAAEGLPITRTQLASFGYSLRTMLAGYPIRFDMAWPGTFNKAPVWYLSLTLK